MSTEKVGIYVAHDDDAILGVGGRMTEHLKNGADVYIVICADGRNSHKAVLGIETNPSPNEVKTIRKEEIKRAMAVLGIAEERLFFLELTDGEGKVWQNQESAKSQIEGITNRENPNIIYFHYPDAHTDHTAVGNILLRILPNLPREIEAYQFVIWTKELAKNRPEVAISQIPKMPSDVLEIDISKFVDLKRKALFEMRSQVNLWPYPQWQVQEKPILDKKFIDFFLRGQEIFVKVQRLQSEN